MNWLKASLKRYPQLAILLIVVAIATVTFENFLNPMNLSAIGFHHSLIGFLALGQLLVIVTRGIDLSQGAVLAVAAMAVAGAANTYGPVAGIAAGLVVGSSIGFANGLIVALTRIPPFVATLGMMGIARGIALTLTNSAPVRLTERDIVTLAWTKWFMVPLAAWVFLTVAICLAVFLRSYAFGRHIYAIGGHEEHARLSGVQPVRVKLLAYSLSGCFCGIAAVFLTARLGTGHPLSGNGWELESIAAVIIGGAGLMGGTGRVIGIVCGVLILGVADSVINLAGISPYLHGGLKGLIILFAVILGSRAPAFRAFTAWWNRKRLQSTDETTKVKQGNIT